MEPTPSRGPRASSTAAGAEAAEALSSSSRPTQPSIANASNIVVNGGTAGNSAVAGTATTLAAAGGGGGASGGDGGDGTLSTAASGAAEPGTTGDFSTTVTPQPELLFYLSASVKSDCPAGKTCGQCMGNLGSFHGTQACELGADALLVTGESHDKSGLTAQVLVYTDT